MTDKPKPKKATGRAASPTMVRFRAEVGVAGDGYRLLAGEVGEIPAKSAEIQEKEGKGKILKGVK
jgi:hypothetical protein